MELPLAQLWDEIYISSGLFGKFQQEVYGLRLRYTHPMKLSEKPLNTNSTLLFSYQP